VAGVSQLVDFDVSLALEALLRRGQEDDTVDHGLLDAEPAEFAP